MSQSYKEQSQARKRVREGIIEPHPHGHKSDKPAPIIVQFRWRAGERMGKIFSERQKWRKAGAYRDMDTALDTIKLQTRKHPYFEYRIKPEDEDERTD